MTVPPASALLEVWERAFAQPLAVKAFALLALARPEASLEELASWTIGQRDRALLELRHGLFGAHLDAVATCPACAQQLELGFATQDVMAKSVQIPATLEVNAAGHRVRVRLPTVQDLTQLRAEHSAMDLLERCLLEVRSKKKTNVLVRALPNEVLTAINEAMSKADPQALIELALECPTCAHRWLSVFDIASYLWRELDTWARRTLQDVHQLARAYGWREADVLALSPTRRRLYLEMVSA
jgi:hypothetical protein